MTLLRILMVEDVESDAEIIFRELKRSGLQFEYRRVETAADLTRECDEFAPGSEAWRAGQAGNTVQVPPRIG